tara:strand:+ start:148 stop:420 length:273 start_codon:yes stop_codon:yes gene_type:complete
MWLTLVFIATVSAGDSEQVQCAEDLNERMALVLERLQEVQAQQEITASEPTSNTTTSTPAQDESSSSTQPAPVPPLLDTSDEDAVAESPV